MYLVGLGWEAETFSSKMSHQWMLECLNLVQIFQKGQNCELYSSFSKLTFWVWYSVESKLSLLENWDQCQQCLETMAFVVHLVLVLHPEVWCHLMPFLVPQWLELLGFLDPQGVEWIFLLLLKTKLLPKLKPKLLPNKEASLKNQSLGY